MRIAIFTEVFLPKIDGITNRLGYTLRCLEELGHEVVIFAPEGAVETHAGARVVPVCGLRFRPDVVHAVGPACLGIWGIATARALKLPVLASYHTDLPRYLPEYGLLTLSVGGNAAITAFRALSTEALPEAHRGTLGGAMGVAASVGAVLGMGLVSLAAGPLGAAGPAVAILAAAAMPSASLCLSRVTPPFGTRGRHHFPERLRGAPSRAG